MIEKIPFMLRLSKHEIPFFSCLLELLAIKIECFQSRRVAHGE